MWRYNFHINRRLPPPRFHPVNHRGKQTSPDVPMIERWILLCNQSSVLQTAEKLWTRKITTTDLKRCSHVMFVIIQVKKKKRSTLFFFLTDIQECYEVTLQLNKEQTVVKEDSRQDAWEVIFFTLQKMCFMFTLYLVSHVLCFTTWLCREVTRQPAKGVNTCVPGAPTWIDSDHESWRL